MGGCACHTRKHQTLLCRKKVDQPLTVAKAADDAYRAACSEGLADKDFSAVHSTIKGNT
jgi:hypothetical protein